MLSGGLRIEPAPAFSSRDRVPEPNSTPCFQLASDRDTLNYEASAANLSAIVASV